MSSDPFSKVAQLFCEWLPTAAESVFSLQVQYHKSWERMKNYKYMQIQLFIQRLTELNIQCTNAHKKIFFPLTLILI